MLAKAGNPYDKTVVACFVAYTVQSIVNNFAPLLFLTFQESFGIPLSQITLLVTVNFTVQLIVDVASTTFVDRIGYRTSMVLAHVAVATGLVLLAVLPSVLPSPFVGLLVAVATYAVGGGLLEVLVSPVVEACPTPNKEKAMSLLHSFFCWGSVAVVLISTIVFHLFGMGAWRALAFAWAIIPVANSVVFTCVPIASLVDEGEVGMGVRDLLGLPLFWALFVMMLCAGASEQVVSQWSSTFAEVGLGVSKTVGDLAGPMAFAVLMGTSRAIYGRYGDRLPLDRFMIASCALCVAAYLGIVLLPIPQLSLVCCALSGFAVGIMWPGTFSVASASLPKGGTAMFALLALAGDVGCSAGPTMAGLISGAAGGNLKCGILAGTLFPAVLLLVLVLRKRNARP